MSSAEIKGWCPGAHRPMLSGDGLVVRIRPTLARLTRSQMFTLCDLAQGYGNGFLELTNRANLQLRGIAQDDHIAVLTCLEQAHLLDPDPETERRRNILVNPFWQPGDVTGTFAADLGAALSQLPDLPAKVGFAIDCGAMRYLAHASADIRIERAVEGNYCVRADGAERGWHVSKEAVLEATLRMAEWLAGQISLEVRRMRHAVLQARLPAAWHTATPVQHAAALKPGATPFGTMLGAAFGQIEAEELRKIFESDQAITALRLTTERLFILEGSTKAPDGFILEADDPLLRISACPGKPFCPQASVETRSLARRIAPRIKGHLHISGCAKGCARMAPSDITLTGRDGRFDLVLGGRAWDQPVHEGLQPDMIETYLP